MVGGEWFWVVPDSFKIGTLATIIGPESDGIANTDGWYTFEVGRELATGVEPQFGHPQLAGPVCNIQAIQTAEAHAHVGR
jgi:hypothetical protein